VPDFDRDRLITADEEFLRPYELGRSQAASNDLTLVAVAGLGSGT
jgi:hypothetical protein